MRLFGKKLRLLHFAVSRRLTGLFSHRGCRTKSKPDRGKFMTTTGAINLLAGLFQFVVAAYALRLNLLFGTRRVGWSLFLAFTLLAALHVLQAVAVCNFIGGVNIEFLYLLVSFLLLTSLVHQEGLLREHVNHEFKERQIRAELEIEVKRKTAYLVKALEGLQAEMDERQRMAAEVSCLDLLKPRLFDCFAEMLASIPAQSITPVLARESYMLSVDLVRQRPLLATDVGSILIFARFVAAGGNDIRGIASVELPPPHVEFYRQTVERLIEAGELEPSARVQFAKFFGGADSDTAFVVAPELETAYLNRRQIAAHA
jgi:hypothetical protein